MQSYAGAADQYGYVLVYTDTSVYKSGGPVPLDILTPENVREYESRVRNETGKPVTISEIVEADRLVILDLDAMEQLYFGCEENNKAYRYAGQLRNLDFNYDEELFVLVKRTAVEMNDNPSAASI